jgi:uncharacterized protein YodC (DUF2158 family)
VEEIKKGDVVRLKSGGPTMTVQNVGNYSRAGVTDGAFCIWFDGAKQQGHAFDRATLEIATKVAKGGG